MNLVTFTSGGWEIHYEGLMYDPGTRQDRPTDLATGVEEFGGFQFGFPTPSASRTATTWPHTGPGKGAGSACAGPA